MVKEHKIIRNLIKDTIKKHKTIKGKKKKKNTQIKSK